MKSNIVAVIQARMGSTRFPAKVLVDLAGQPMIAQVVRRVTRASHLRQVVVAIPKTSRDDPLADLCRSRGWHCYRGSEDDVLDRYYGAAREYSAEGIVRVTSDCPLIDPGMIDEVVALFLDGKWDYVSNTLEPRTFPRGLDVEVFTYEALEVAWEEDTNSSWREHVTPYIYRHPERFLLKGVSSDADYSDMRWTVDTVEDLRFVKRIFNHFGDDIFNWTEVLEVLQQHPEWLDLNREVEQRTVD